MPSPSKPQPKKRSAAAANASLRFWNIRNVAGGLPTLELFGDIGESQTPDEFWGGEPGAGTFQEFVMALRAIGNVPVLRVEIFSNGGSVIVGKAIHDRLLEHPAQKTAVIYGICASAATYPALACDAIQIPANSFFLIHECRACAYGTAQNLRSMADSLEVADASIAALYAARTGKTVGEIRDIMAADTWMTGEQAVEMGLADECIEPITMEPKERLEPANFSAAAIHRMPSAAKAWFDSVALSNALQNNKPYTIMSAPASAPAPAPATPVVPAAAPVVPTALAPVNLTPVVTPPPAAPAPVAQPDFATMISNAIASGIATAMAPMSATITDLQNRIAYGVTAPQLGGAQPAAGAIPNLGGEPKPAPINYATADALTLISEGCRAAFEKAGVK